MQDQDDPVRECLNRCKLALDGLSAAQLWAIFAAITGTSVVQAMADYPNKKRGWLLSEICHHICDGNYSQEPQEFGPPGDPSLDHDPPRPKC